MAHMLKSLVEAVQVYRVTPAPAQRLAVRGGCPAGVGPAGLASLSCSFRNNHHPHHRPHHHHAVRRGPAGVVGSNGRYAVGVAACLPSASDSGRCSSSSFSEAPSRGQQVRGLRALADVEGERGSAEGSHGYCPGCGIKLQCDSEDKPGYFRPPAPKKQDPRIVAAEETASLLFGDDAPAPSDAAGLDEAAPAPAPAAAPFCARCFSLRNYGRVKNPDVEDQLPVFDVASKLATRVINIKGIRQVLLCVVDVTDFDGSLPTQTLTKLFTDRKIREKNVSLIVAVNKVDLLPRVASDKRLQTWCRKQLRSLEPDCLPEDVSVKLVSAVAGKGIPDLASALEQRMGQYGHLWVFGAQNAGKSSLINALTRHASSEGRGGRGAFDGGRAKGKAKGKRAKGGHTHSHGGGPPAQLTEASLPGTTIGFVRLENLLAGSRCKAFDTPGLLHKYQYTSTYSPLSYEEIGMLLPRRKLKPRTYRCMVGYSLSIGGLARVDLLAAPGQSVYVTLWASDEVTTHFGKTENSEKKQLQAVGDLLMPPLSPDHVPNLVPSEFLVGGDSWKRSSEDVAIAGLGWVSVGVQGQCKLRVWAPKSVLLLQREALMPDFARDFERPGYQQMLPKSK